MTLKKITLAFAVTVITASSALALPPVGPGGEIAPCSGGGCGGGGGGPGFGGPGGFAPPPGPGGGGGGGGGFNPALGAIIGIGAFAAGAAAASAYDDDDLVCWKEKRKGKIVTVCAED
jgi:hypothetical protein